ncbi:SDR family oxidoreductase [Stigmatella hybrida]|uniref:SDR family oxidoreductase n=1 Tax=Stigmatella hybrida TaxID=394097 RepID=UPI001CDAC079|nr:SDR family oxidoreductase [Stigmatella hybrida]
MRVFVTGATGFIGSAVVRELREAGHRVLGLARSEEAAGALAQAGAEAHRGSLSDPESLAAGARACEGVIHLAFIHDFSQYKAAVETDQGAVEAIARALEGSNKPFVAASGTVMLTPGRIGTETDARASANPFGGRAAAEETLISAAKRGVRTSAVRLPPSVHGAGDQAFVPTLIDIARQKGFSAFIGDGTNRWPSVHRLDAARLFRLALEKAVPGSLLHGAAEEGIPMRRIAETIGEGLGLPVRSIAANEAAAHFGWLAGFAALDNPTSSALTQEWLGWRPRENTLLKDMRESGYFDGAQRSKLLA